MTERICTRLQIDVKYKYKHEYKHDQHATKPAVTIQAT